MLRVASSLLLPFAGFLLSSAAAAGVLVVGPPGSGAPFQDVQAAIDAAQPGDTVLVQAGTYGTALIAKPIDLIGAGSGQVTLVSPHHEQHALAVTSIAAGESVVVAGLHLQGTIFFGPPFHPPVAEARLHANAGTVVLQDIVCNDTVGGVRIEGTALALIDSCWLIGDSGSLDAFTSPGLSIEGSTAWVMNSVVQGGHDSSWIGAPAIHCQSSVLYLAGSEVTGGRGGHPFGCDLEAGAGVLMNGGLLKAVGPGGFIHGGDAESGFSTGAFCSGAGHGGPGIQLGGAADAILADALPVEGGLHDQEYYPGSAPPVLVEPGSDLWTHPSLYPTLSASQPTVTLGGAVALTLHGNPLGQGWIFFSLGLGTPTLFPGVDGAVILPPGSVLLATLPLGASGAASLPLAVPPVPGLLGVAAVFQGLETSAPQVAVSNPVFVTISG